MKRYINITGRIEVEVRDRNTNDALWGYQNVIAIEHDKYLFYIYTVDNESSIKLSKGRYRIAIRGEL